MKNPADLTQALENLKREAQKATQEYNIKEAELRKTESMIPQLKQEILLAERTLEEKKKSLTEAERNLPKMRMEINRLRIELNKKSSDIQNIQREYTQALGISKIK